MSSYTVRSIGSAAGAGAITWTAIGLPSSKRPLCPATIRVYGSAIASSMTLINASATESGGATDWQRGVALPLSKMSAADQWSLTECPGQMVFLQGEAPLLAGTAAAAGDFLALITFEERTIAEVDIMRDRSTFL